MTVQELINELSKYPKDKKVYTDWGLANYIGENFSGDILLKHRDTEEEKRKTEELFEQMNRERCEESERGRDMPTFASRW